jgi:hypothetical protein
MNRVPAHIEERVVAKLYADAHALRWHLLSPNARTKQYGRWLEDPEVGGLLLRFLSAEEARLWIKDGPMKEYARAVAGIGRWSKHLPSTRNSADAVVRAVCGEGWHPLEGSQGIKPLHCDATDGNEGLVRVYWGYSRDFKHLLWAALVAESDGRHARVGVLEDLARPTTDVDRRRHRWLAARCGLSVVHVTVK